MIILVLGFDEVALRKLNNYGNVLNVGSLINVLRPIQAQRTFHRI